MSDADEIWAAVLDMYAGYLAGDRPRIDQHIAEDATVWDSAEPGLLVGLAELDAMRARRPDSDPEVSDLRATDQRIAVHGDFGWGSHLLHVTFADEAVPPQLVRNTGVWQRRDGRWQVVHNHEDVIEG